MHSSSRIKNGRVQTAPKKTDPDVEGGDTDRQNFEDLEERDGDNIDELDIQLEAKEQR